MYVCIQIVFLLFMIKVRVRWCNCSLWRSIITLGKLIGLLFLLCPHHPLYFVFENSKNKRNDLAHPIVGTIFLVMFNTDSRYILVTGVTFIF